MILSAIFVCDEIKFVAFALRLKEILRPPDVVRIVRDPPDVHHARDLDETLEVEQRRELGGHRRGLGPV